MFRLILVPFLMLSFACGRQADRSIDGAPQFGFVATSSLDAPQGWSSSTEHEEVIVVDLSLGSVLRLTKDGCDDRYPSLSPDRKRVAFSSGRPASGPFSGNGTHRLFVYDLASRNILPLFELVNKHLSGSLKNAQMEYPVWGKTTGRIAFCIDNSEYFRIAVYDPAVDTLFLGPRILDPLHFCWSPNERYIAFDGNKPARGLKHLWTPLEYGLGIVDLVSGNVTMIDSTRRCREAIDWAPSGQKLLVSQADSEYAPIVISEYILASREFVTLDTVASGTVIGYGETENDILHDHPWIDSSHIYIYNKITKQSEPIGPSLRRIEGARIFR